MSEALTSRFLQFPSETLDSIFQYSARNELAQLLRVNHYIHDVAIRILYRSIPELEDQKTVDCLLSICSNDFNAPLVRRIAVDWRNISLRDPIPQRPLPRLTIRSIFKRRSSQAQDRRTLLNTALRRLTNLTDLNLFLATHDNVAEIDHILTGCSFSLATLVTSLSGTEPLISFLATQPRLINLNLAGGIKSTVTLNPSSLPNLEAFGWAHRECRRNPNAITDFMKGKPITRVSVVLSSKDTEEAVDILSSSGCPIDFASFAFRDVVEDPMAKIGTRLSSIRRVKLGLVELPSQETLISMSSSISKMQALKCVEIEVRRASCEDLAENMRGAVRKWLEDCPSLCHVDFPQCGQRIRRIKPIAVA